MPENGLPEQAGPEPLDLDPDQELVEEAIEETEDAIEAERDALDVPLPPGALDGAAGQDLFGEEDPSVLRPGEDGGAVYPPALSEGAVEPEVIATDDAAGPAGVSDDELRSLSPEELTEAVAATSESLASEGVTGALVDRARGLDISDYTVGEEVSELRTTHSRTFLAEDGTFRTELGSEQMFVEEVDGALVEPDSRPVGRRDGRWEPTAGRPGLSFGGTARDDALAALSFDGGRSVSWSLSGAARAPGRRNGQAVTYEDVFDGVDLEMEASLAGVKETIVIHDPQSPRSYEFPLDLTGLVATLEDPYGSIVLSDDESGEPVGVIPSGWAQDSGSGPNGETPDPGLVAYELVGSGADTVLRVSVDEAWFSDPARIFPVRVDPTVADYRMSGDTWVHNQYPTTNRSTSTILKTGGGGGNRRTYFARWDVGWLVSATILDATYNTLQGHAWSCTPSTLGVFRVTSDWNPATVTWGSQPGFDVSPVGLRNVSYGRSGCPANWIDYPMTGVVQKWVDGVYPAYGITGRVSTYDTYDDNNTYKEFVSSEGGGNGGQVLQIVWSPWRVKYQVASSLVPPTATSGGSIKIKVTNRAPTTWNATGTNRYRLGYHVYQSNGSTLVKWEGGRVNLPSNVGWGQSAVVTVPISALPVGNYVLKFDMLQEGVRWFSQEGDHADLYPLPVPVPVGNTRPEITSASPAGMSDSRTPTLQVSGVNPDNYPSGALQYQFKICEDQKMTAACVQSAWGGTQWAPTHLVWGKTYYWNAAVRETGTGALTTQPTWKAPLTPTVVQPELERHFGSDEYAPLHGGVNPSIGNYVASFTDIQVAAAGLPVELSRTYNSMDTRVGAFGPGWSSPLDLVAKVETGGRLLVSFPDGSRERYGVNPDGSWTPPPGNASVLRSVDGGGWELQRPDRKVYAFDAGGLLVAIRDGWGNALEITRDTTTSLIDRVTSTPSGRFMDLTWDDEGPDGVSVVTAASTNPDELGAAAPVWTYSYDGGRLTGVCAPGEPEPDNQCTAYSYHGTGRGAEGKLSAITRQEGNTAVSLDYRTDGSVAWVENGTANRWTFTDGDDEAEGTYHPVNGWRAANGVQVSTTGTLKIDVTGSGGVPEQGVQAVVVNVAVASYGGGWLAAYPSGTPEPSPNVSTMDYSPGVRSTLHTVALGSDGKFSLTNHGSQAALITADVVGWYAAAGVADGSVFVPVATKRILDTRVSGQGPALGAGTVRSVQVTGKGGVPSDGVRAVVFNLEMVGATTGTDLVTYAAGAPRPAISTAVTGGGMVDNLQVAAVGDGGKINVHNAAGSVHVLVDVVGYFADPALHEGSVFRPLTNYRLLDSRRTTGQWTTPWPAGGTRPVLAAGQGSIPARGVTAVVGELQAVTPASTNTNRTTPTGTTAAGTTTYIAQAGQYVGNHFYVGLGDTGSFDLTSQISQDMIVDVVGYFTPIPRTAFVEDPRGNTVEYRYDTLGRLVGRTDEDAYRTAYAYGDDGFLSSMRDESGLGHTYGYDDGHLSADTLVRVMGDPFEATIRDWETTTHYGYVDDPDTPARDGKLAWVADPRSADAEDTSYRTTYTYDTYGQPLTVRGPGLAGAPEGVGVTKSYADGTTAPAVCPEVGPAGLLETESDAAGLTTTYCYDPTGDLRETHHPSGLVDRYTYDDLGRVRTHTQVSDTFPAGVTTERTYDAKGRVVTDTGAAATTAVTSPVDGPQHQVESTTTYTPNGNIDQVTVADTQTDDSRWVEYTYDNADRMTGSLDSAGRATAQAYDANGNVASRTGVDGARTRYTYDRRNNQRSVIADDVVDDPIDAPTTTRDIILGSQYYDAHGRVWKAVDANGRSISNHWSPTGTLEHSSVRTHTDTDPETGMPQGPQRTLLLAGGQVDRAGNVMRAIAPSNVAAVDEFDGTGLEPAWATSGSWSVAGGELAAAGPGLAWREGAVDGQVGITVGSNDPVSVALRVEDAANYLQLIWENTSTVPDTAVLRAYQVVDGVATEFQGNLAASVTEGDRIEVAFTGNRLRVFRNGAYVMEQTIPTDTTGTGVGVVATGAGQGAERFRFDAYQRTEVGIDAYGRQISTTVDPGGAGLHTEWSLLPDGRPEAIIRTNTVVPTPVATTRFGYDPASGMLAWSEDVIADPDPEASGDEVTAPTQYHHDQRGYETSVTSPGGAVVDRTYDELGRLSSVTGPARTVERHGEDLQEGVRPTEAYEYTAFGELHSVEDPTGRSTVYTIDDRGFAVEATLPAYTPPDGGTAITPVVATSFDDAGRVLTETDPLGATHEYTYNTLGLLVAEQQPAIGDDPAGAWRYRYDNAGRPVESRDPTGAVVRQRLDMHGRVTATETHVRQPTPDVHVTAVVLGDAGGSLRSRTPEGVVTTTSYDLAGRVAATADADGNPTTFGYDGQGQLQDVNGPDGRGTSYSYDLVGNRTIERTHGPDGTALDETRFTWNLDGLLEQVTSPRGVAEGYTTTRMVYDSAGQTTQRVTAIAPDADVVETWGYDELGQPTRYTDGRGNTTWQTYNALGLPEDAIEPAAGAQTDPADRRWRTVYDAAGRPVSQHVPGGIQVTSTYDELGRLTDQAGSGAQAATASRSFDYDELGRVIQASTPTAVQSFTYDDRGLLLSANGASGDSSFAYDGDARLVTQTDGSGVMSLSYDNRGLPDTVTSSLTGTVNLAFDEAGRPAQVDYGDNTTRSFTYDPWGRLDIDRLATGDAELYTADYGYDLDGNITSKNVTGTDVPAAGANQYSYDWASRITSWTDPAGNIEAYAWDAASNRTQSGATTATFDEQNRLLRTEGPEGLTTNTWAANGTLDTQRVQRRVALVVADPVNYATADGVLAWLLVAAGNAVTVVDDSDPAPTDGVDVVVVTPTVDPTAVGDKYKDLPVPVVNLAAATWQASGLTSAASTETTSSSGHVSHPEHPLSAGNTGTALWLQADSTLHAIAPEHLGAGAVGVWTRAETSSDVLVAGYETGSATPGGPAGERRVTVGLSADAITRLNTTGWDAFAAALEWADANDTELGTTNFDFDAFEQPARITGPDGTPVDYTYDALGRRLDSPTGALTYAGMSIRPSTDGTSRFQPGPLGSLAVDDTTDGGGVWAHTDAHTDVVGAFTPGDIALTDPQAFSPWGQPVTPSALPLGYQSERQDLPGGLIGMGAREYDPSTGTFLSHDPANDPLVPNGYSYTPANPLAYTDPTGLFREDPQYTQIITSSGPVILAACSAACAVGVGIGAVAVGAIVVSCVMFCDNWFGGNDYSFGGLKDLARQHLAQQAANEYYRDYEDGWSHEPQSRSYGDEHREPSPRPQRDPRTDSRAPGDGPSDSGGPRHRRPRSGGSGDGRPAPRPQREIFTDPGIVRNPPPMADSELAGRVKGGASAVSNYDGRFQTDPSTGTVVDTGIASRPTAAVTPEITEDSVISAIPEIVLQLVGGDAGGSLSRPEMFVPDDMCGWRESRGTVGTGETAHALTECGAGSPALTGDDPGRRSVPALRQAYVDAVASIADEVAAWRSAGADSEFIAREAWADRRALGIQYKNLTPAGKLAEIHARNTQKYGDPLGPSIDWLRARGKTWEQIIESATRTGGRDLGF